MERITQHNVRNVIAAANLESITPDAHAHLVGYFSDLFGELGRSSKVISKFSAIGKIFFGASAQLDRVRGQQSLEVLAETHTSLFEVLIACEPDFKVFVDKFLPNLKLNSKSLDEILDCIETPVEEGKIIPVQFPSKPVPTYTGEEAIRDISSDSRTRQ